MIFRTVALTCLAAAGFLACGRLDLGDYASRPPQGSNGTSVIFPPVGATGGEATEGGAGSSGEPAPVPPRRGEGGADGAREPAEGGAGGAGAAAAGAAGAGGDSGEPRSVRPSCAARPDLRCGVEELDCCAVQRIPAGYVVRGGVEQEPTRPVPSHVSEFYLGTFEVTVVRFKAFLEHYDEWRAGGALQDGAGEHPRIPGSGWRSEWLRPAGDAPDSCGLAATREAVEREVSTCLTMPFSTKIWLQPVNCVTFYEAQAFCIWDGGRLPTDLEWEHAAAGGIRDRLFPWGDEAPTLDFAFFACSSNIGAPCNIPPVGSFTQGKGLFGQFDLAGSVAEWTLDTVGPAFPTPCNDCANVEPMYIENPRNTRGGNWTSDATDLEVPKNHFMDPRYHLPMHGIRCAYDVAKE